MRKQPDRDLKRTLSALLLMAAGIGLLVYQLGDPKPAKLVTAAIAFIAGLVLLARRAR